MKVRFIWAAFAAMAAVVAPSQSHASDKVLGAAFDDEAAPLKDGVTVCLTDIEAGSPYLPLLNAAVKAFRPKAVLRFERGEVSRLKADIARIRPSDVIVVSPPQTLDLPFHAEMIRICVSVDQDPFPDFRFGYFTCALPAEGEAFVRAAARGSAFKGRFPASLTESGVAIKSRLDHERPSLTCPGLKVQRLLNSGPEFLYQNKVVFENRGFVLLFGDSSPIGMDDGVNSRFLRETRVKMAPAIIVSGGSLLATADYHYPEGADGRNRQVDPGESFVLAALSREPSGLMLGFGNESHEAAARELERMTFHGHGPAEAMRETWIEGLMSLPGETLEEALKAELDKKPGDHAGWFSLLSRAYFGDPSWSSLRPLGKPVATVKTAVTENSVGIEYSVSGAESLSTFTFPFDGKDMDLVFFSVQIPAAHVALAAAVREVEAKSGERFPRVALCRVGLDRWADGVSLRVFLLLDSMGGGRAFRTGETTRVKLVLGRE